MAIGRGIVCLPKSAKVFSSVSMRYFLFTLPILTVYVPCACCAVHRSNASFRLTHLPSCRHFIHLLFCVCRCDGVRPGTCTHDACLISVTSDDSMYRCWMQWEAIRDDLSYIDRKQNAVGRQVLAEWDSAFGFSIMFYDPLTRSPGLYWLPLSPSCHTTMSQITMYQGLCEVFGSKFNVKWFIPLPEGRNKYRRAWSVDSWGRYA